MIKATEQAAVNHYAKLLAEKLPEGVMRDKVREVVRQAEQKNYRTELTAEQVAEIQAARAEEIFELLDTASNEERSLAALSNLTNAPKVRESQLFYRNVIKVAINELTSRGLA